MAKRRSRRSGNASQRIMQIIGVLIVVSMILAVLVPFFGTGRRVQPTPTPLPPEPTATPLPQPTPTEAVVPGLTPAAAPSPASGG